MNSNINFFTFFSKGYLPHAASLLASLKQTQPGSRVIACVLDSESLAILKPYPGVEIFSFTDVTQRYPALLCALEAREGASAIFSSVPSMARFALELIREGELLHYLDADTFALRDFSEVDYSMQGRSVGLYPHDFNPLVRPVLERYGVFNAGAFVIRNNDAGRAFLDRWASLCFEWCEDRLFGSRYSNQGYLTSLALEFPSAVVSLHPTNGNIAPWNAGWFRARLKHGKVLQRGKPILFFHFHGIIPRGNLWFISHLRYGFALSPKVVKSLYGNYIRVFVQQAAYFGVEIQRSKRFSTNLFARAFFALQFGISRLLGQYVKL